MLCWRSLVGFKCCPPDFEPYFALQKPHGLEPTLTSTAIVVSSPHMCLTGTLGRGDQAQCSKNQQLFMEVGCVWNRWVPDPPWFSSPLTIIDPLKASGRAWRYVLRGRGHFQPDCMVTCTEGAFWKFSFQETVLLALLVPVGQTSLLVLQDLQDSPKSWSLL